MKAIKQVAELFARLLKLIENKEYDRAIQALQSACPSLLGIDYGPLSFADAQSTGQLLGDKEKVRVFARLVAKEAEILALKGSSSAEHKRRLALELFGEAAARGAKMDAESIAAVKALAPEVGLDTLSERHRSALAPIVG